jgi:predicted alpha-1,2-mannosidase
MKKRAVVLCVLGAACLAGIGGELKAGAPAEAPRRQPVDWVNPFVGTAQPGLRWMLFPGPAMPFGMVKLSPDNRGPKSWDAGYDYANGTIYGFSHIHEWTMTGLLMMPATGPLKVELGPESGSPSSFRSRFCHATESASPGYYAVTLDDYNVRAELTATTRAGFQRYTFPKADQARVIMVLKVPGEYDSVVKGARIRRVSSTEIEGESEQTNADQGGRFQQYKLHFVIRFSKPFDSMGGWVGPRILSDTSEIVGADNVGAFASYHTEAGEVIEVKTGISLVSIEQARLNLDTEMNRFGWDFDAARQNARDAWNSLLSKIEVTGGTEAERVKFYSNLYHAYVARTIWSDVNGKYVDPLGHVQQLRNPDSPVYGCDAFWNLFWNLNQLWTLLTPQMAAQWVNSELELNDRGGWLARGPAGLRYSGIMVAEHEISLIVSAWQKGIRNFDAEKAFQAIKHVQTTPGFNFYGKDGGYVGNEKIEVYDKLGYMPIEDGQVSLTLEYAYDDWCTAQLARALGKMDDYNFFLKRAQNYRHVWDSSVGYFRPRHRDGTWVADFSPFDSKNYTEGTAWQYAWFVPHDMKGLVELMGEREFIRRLEEGFENSRPRFDSEDKYVNVGNQPNMQAPWLFNYAGAPWLTQKWVREVMEHSFGDGPQGYVGDEDQGQSGAWYTMSAMGLFEMDGGCALRPIYEIGSPVFDRVVIHLDPKYYPGRRFVIEARHNSPQNVYIQSATLNGKAINQPWIYHSDVMKGGELVLEMGPQPNKNWGSAPQAAPPQL